MCVPCGGGTFVQRECRPHMPQNVSETFRQRILFSIIIIHIMLEIICAAIDAADAPDTLSCRTCVRRQPSRTSESVRENVRVECARAKICNRKSTTHTAQQHVLCSRKCLTILRSFKVGESRIQTNESRHQIRRMLKFKDAFRFTHDDDDDDDD